MADKFTMLHFQLWIGTRGIKFIIIQWTHKKIVIFILYARLTLYTLLVQFLNKIPISECYSIQIQYTNSVFITYTITIIVVRDAQPNTYSKLLFMFIGHHHWILYPDLAGPSKQIFQTGHLTTCQPAEEFP